MLKHFFPRMNSDHNWFIQSSQLFGWNCTELCSNYVSKRARWHAKHWNAYASIIELVFFLIYSLQSTSYWCILSWFVKLTAFRRVLNILYQSYACMVINYCWIHAHNMSEFITREYRNEYILWSVNHTQVISQNWKSTYLRICKTKHSQLITWYTDTERAYWTIKQIIECRSDVV